MALKATVYKVRLQVADVDRGYYEEHALTLARHPSETEQRLMIRLLAFALYAGPGLSFGRGLSSDDEPDLWERDDSGEIRHWVEVGLPDERRLRRAAGRARRVTVLAYGQRSLEVWWQKQRSASAHLPALTVLALSDVDADALTRLAARNLVLQCTIQDGQVLLNAADACISVEPLRLTAS
jgi:uncharacterized protein YaeQ